MSSVNAEQISDELAESNARQYLTFSVAEEMYCVDISCTKEIIEYGNLTDVPLMPEFVRGVLNLRGRVVPIIDLAARFERDATNITKRSCIIIVEVGQDKSDIGILVDGVSEVLEIPNDSVETAPNFGAKIRADFISGMARMDDGFLVVLKIDNVLSVEEMSALADISKTK